MFFRGVFDSQFDSHLDLELGRHSNCDFTNPDFVAYAESLGVKGYRVSAAAELLPTLRRALADDSVSLIVCPVDYCENLALTKMRRVHRPLLSLPRLSWMTILRGSEVRLADTQLSRTYFFR